MDQPRTARLAFWLLAALLAFQALYYYPQLPDTMSSHFNGAGAPNGFQSKAGFFLLFTVMMGAVGLVMAFGVPALVASRPEITNLPNKEHWLAPERRPATLAFLTGHFTWFGCAILLLGNVILNMVVEFHIRHQAAFPSAQFTAVLAVFLAFVALWMLRLYSRLGRPR